MTRCVKCHSNIHHRCLENKTCECPCHTYFFCRFNQKHPLGESCKCPDPNIRKEPDPEQEAKFEKLISQWRTSKLDEHKEHNKRMRRLIADGISKEEELHFFLNDKGEII